MSLILCIYFVISLSLVMYCLFVLCIYPTILWWIKIFKYIAFGWREPPKRNIGGPELVQLDQMINLPLIEPPDITPLLTATSGRLRHPRTSRRAACCCRCCPISITRSPELTLIWQRWSSLPASAHLCYWSVGLSHAFRTARIQHATLEFLSAK